MKEEKDDFFDEIPEDKPVKKKEPKKPTIQPDDPAYYDQEEGRWEHLSPSPYRRVRLLWGAFGVLVVIALFFSVYIYFFTPEISEASEEGYVEEIQKEGLMFKTFEGTMIPYKSIMDTLRPYENDFRFTVNDDHIAAELLRRRNTGKPVRVQYEVYRTRLPWRGKSKVVVVGLDSVVPTDILPPVRRPEAAQ